MAPSGGISPQSETGKGSETPKKSTWEKSTTNIFFSLDLSETAQMIVGQMRKSLRIDLAKPGGRLERGLGSSGYIRLVAVRETFTGPQLSKTIER
jgi:hypothetical protein